MVGAHTRERDVEYILDGVGNKVTTATCEASSLEDINDVVPVDQSQNGVRAETPHGTHIMMFIPES